MEPARLKKAFEHIDGAIKIIEERRDPSLQMLSAITELYSYLYEQQENVQETSSQEFDWSQAKPGMAFWHKDREGSNEEKWRIYLYLCDEPVLEGEVVVAKRGSVYHISKNELLRANPKYDVTPENPYPEIGDEE